MRSATIKHSLQLIVYKAPTLLINLINGKNAIHLMCVKSYNPIDLKNPKHLIKQIHLSDRINANNVINLSIMFVSLLLLDNDAMSCVT